MSTNDPSPEDLEKLRVFTAQVKDDILNGLYGLTRKVELIRERAASVKYMSLPSEDLLVAGTIEQLCTDMLDDIRKIYKTAGTGSNLVC